MKKLFITLLLLIPLVLLCVCDGSPVSPSGSTEGYYLSGTIIKNIDLDRLSIKTALTRNDTTLTNAILFVGNDTLAYNSGYYSFIFDSISELSVGNHYLTIVDSTLFSDSVMFSIASDFEITSRVPADTTPYRPGDNVLVSWSTTTNIDGYIYAAVKTGDHYSEDGYSAFVTSGVPSTAFDSDAFALPSGELDTGWYYIHIYGYKDSPLPGTNIPTVFPAGLSNSISRTNFKGKFGSIIVTERDSIHATTSK